MAPPAAPKPVSRVGIVGVGLIGGSIALALRERAPATRIVIVDREPVAAAALARGMADLQARSVTELTDVDLIVLATPIPAILDAVALLGDRQSAAIVTDVGSTKRHIVAAAHRAQLATFVGGHPMAGRERGGLDVASADLFNGRRWFVVPAETQATSAVLAFVRTVGAEPFEIDAVRHDRTMAYVSHLPQLVSTALMDRVGQGVGPSGLDSAGSGLADLTRLAASPSELWQGIFATNADFVREATTGFMADLAALAGGLDDAAVVRARFDRANRLRDTWLGRRRMP